ncbi:hypothetical protein T03_17784 [Trichinella britovi]|uniref:Uncharacterized protein n=1 Tax=Trichinella britovi TaxID=45882 RepID=A0A0V1BIG9_TRIBR|nr:hypothetical protein T03_17784 [Trichinella britovi]
MNSTNEAQKRLKLLQIHFAVEIALFDVSILTANGKIQQWSTDA